MSLMFSQEESEALATLERCFDVLRDHGFQIACCVSRYHETGANFSTRISLSGTEAEQDHYLLDAIRELSVEWSNCRHAAQLRWAEETP